MLYHLYHLITYTLLGTFVGGMVMWIYQVLVMRVEVINWGIALAWGILQGVLLTWMNRDERHLQYH